MSDLIERLRALHDSEVERADFGTIFQEAADEIATLARKLQTEREECAKIADGYVGPVNPQADDARRIAELALNDIAQEIASAIRSRPKHPGTVR